MALSTRKKMTLSYEHIKQFQMLYKNHFGKHISREEAYDKATKFIRFMEVIYDPAIQTEHEIVQEYPEKGSVQGPERS